MYRLIGGTDDVLGFDDPQSIEHTQNSSQFHLLKARRVQQPFERTGVLQFAEYIQLLGKPLKEREIDVIAQSNPRVCTRFERLSVTAAQFQQQVWKTDPCRSVIRLKITCKGVDRKAMLEGVIEQF